MIYGPSANRSSNTASRIWKSDQNALGTMAEIQFDPEIFKTFIPKDRIDGVAQIMSQRVQDPVISLFHEMLHALRINYGTDMVDKRQVGMYNIAIEELYTVGTDHDLPSAKQVGAHSDARFSSATYTIAKMLSNLYKNQNGEVINRHKNLYLNKYRLDIDGNNKVTVNVEEQKRLLQMLRYSIFEKRLGEELYIETRDSYLNTGTTNRYSLDILNPLVYTEEKGFVINGIIPSQNPIINMNFAKVPSHNLGILNYCGEASVSRVQECISMDGNEIIEFDNSGEDHNEKLFNSINDLDPVEVPKNSDEFIFYKPIKTEDKDLSEESFDQSDLTLERVEMDSPEYQKKNTIFVTKYNKSHVLKANKYNGNLNPTQDEIEFVDADGSDETIKDVINSNKKFYGYNTDTNSNFRNVENFADFYMYAQWTNKVVSDFRNESGLKRVIAVGEDLIEVVPRLGAVYNIGKDISDGKFVEAFKTAGIQLLFENIPEFKVLYVGYEIEKSIISGNPVKLGKMVDNAVLARKKHILSVLEFYLLDWRRREYLQIENSIYNVAQQDEAYKKSILHNLQFHGNKLIENNIATQEQLNELLKKQEAHLNTSLNIALDNISRMLVQGSKRYILKERRKLIESQLVKYNNKMKDTLIEYINNNSAFLEEEFINQLKEKVQTNFTKVDIEDYFDGIEVNNLINHIVHNIITIEDEDISNNILCHLGINDKNLFSDITGLNSVRQRTEEFNVRPGRKNNCGMIKNRGRIGIQPHNYRLYSGILSLSHDFSITTWIRCPFGKSSQERFNKESRIIVLVDVRDPSREMVVSIKKGKLEVSIKNDNQPNTILKSEFIEDNRWHLLTIEFDLSNNEFCVYLDTKLSDSIKFLKSNLEIDNTVSINILGLKTKIPIKDKVFLKIDDFKIYNKFFSQREINKLYHDYKKEVLYDHWGEPLKSGTEYYLNVLNSEGAGNFIYPGIEPILYPSRRIITQKNKYA